MLWYSARSDVRKYVQKTCETSFTKPNRSRFTFWIVSREAKRTDANG